MWQIAPVTLVVPVAIGYSLYWFNPRLAPLLALFGGCGRVFSYRWPPAGRLGRSGVRPLLRARGGLHLLDGGLQLRYLLILRGRRLLHRLFGASGGARFREPVQELRGELLVRQVLILEPEVEFRQDVGVEIGRASCRERV